MQYWLKTAGTGAAPITNPDWDRLHADLTILAKLASALARAPPLIA